MGWLRYGNRRLVFQFVANILATGCTDALGELLPRRAHLIGGAFTAVVKDMAIKRGAKTFLCRFSCTGAVTASATVAAAATSATATTAASSTSSSTHDERD